jgi:deoxyribodipyrimidine photolyase-related protein
MKEILLLLPNQLFKTHNIENLEHIYLWHHSKFFTDLQYHKNKLHYHYATMSAYEDEMKKEYSIQTIEKLTEMKLSKSDFNLIRNGVYKSHNVWVS